MTVLARHQFLCDLGFLGGVPLRWAVKFPLRKRGYQNEYKHYEYQTTSFRCL
jgi:hypothetical protein